MLVVLISAVSLLLGDVAISVPGNDQNLITSYAKMLGKALPLIVRESANVSFLELLCISPSPTSGPVRTISGN